MAYINNRRPSNPVWDYSIFDIVSVGHTTHIGTGGFFISADYRLVPPLYKNRQTPSVVCAFLYSAHLCTRGKYVGALFLYVVFAAQFLDIKQELVINSERCGLGNPGNVLRGDNPVSMHT